MVIREMKREKSEILFRNLEENDEVIFKDNQEYQEANKEYLKALNALKKDMPIDKIRQLNDYDDSIVVLESIMIKEYYKQGYMDAID